jgi:septation ring formation regulator
MTLEVIGIIIFILIVALVLVLYFTKKQNYKKIDELDARKTAMMQSSPTEKLETVSRMSIAGQSKEMAAQLNEQWKTIEKKKYPQIENTLFEAEQATDRYRFKLSSNHQVLAEEVMDEVEETLKKLSSSLDELIQREEANLKKIEAIKKRYHDIRKDLLAKSFSFGRALDTLESHLGIMESDFTEFSDLTASGDHEEAKTVIGRLEENISTMEAQMEKIPAILERIEEDFEKQVVELESGYAKLQEEDYVFPDDTIQAELTGLNSKIQELHNQVEKLELEAAESGIEEIDTIIETLYERMEAEIEAKPEVEELNSDIRKALHFVKEQNRKLFLELDRISQSYVLNQREQEDTEELREVIEQSQEEFEQVSKALENHSLAYSIALEQLDELLGTLEDVYNKHEEIEDKLYSYRKEELSMKKDVDEMEQAMREMKRYIEAKHLPGLPQKYLDFFFYTSDHLETLAKELARPKLDMEKVSELHKMCEEDIEKLGEDTDELVDNALLTEVVSQRLHRHKSEHPGVMETINYSKSLFVDDHDYETALKMVREKLEKIEPGAYDELVEEYQREKTYQ